MQPTKKSNHSSVYIGLLWGISIPVLGIIIERYLGVHWLISILLGFVVATTGVKIAVFVTKKYMKINSPKE